MTMLHEHLAAWSAAGSNRQAVAETVAAIAFGAARLATVIAQGPLAGDLGRVVGPSADHMTWTITFAGENTEVGSVATSPNALRLAA